MLYPDKQYDERGFTLSELIVTMVLLAILLTASAPFLNNAFSQYLILHEDSMIAGTLSIQTQRIANVVRGATDVTIATNDEVEMYAYFAPSDLYVSKIKYYKTDGNTKLKADVTPMTSNPPVGTPITASMRTYTIIENFYQVGGINTFEYLDSTGNTLTLPIADLYTVKGMRINLAVPAKTSTSSTSNTSTIEVSMRNKKTNL